MKGARRSKGPPALYETCKGQPSPTCNATIPTPLPAPPTNTSASPAAASRSFSSAPSAEPLPPACLTGCPEAFPSCAFRPVLISPTPAILSICAVRSASAWASCKRAARVSCSRSRTAAAQSSRSRMARARVFLSSSRPRLAACPDKRVYYLGDSSKLRALESIVNGRYTKQH